MISTEGYVIHLFTILTNSLGSAITFPHFLHLTTSSGSYIGIRTLTVGSELGCSRDKHVRLQVKESRYYRSTKWKSGHIGHSWYQIREEKLLKDDIDFYVFLTYKEDFGEHKVQGFQNKFLIVPKEELKSRIGVKDASVILWFEPSVIGEKENC